jgi:hypothetical protein
MTGNALMVPRALYTRDVIWLLGSTWGSAVGGWGVMLSLFLGRRAADGARCVNPEPQTLQTLSPHPPGSPKSEISALYPVA